MIGIYKIENTINGHVYIGQSLRVEIRLSQHKTDLRGGYSGNVYLQRAFNKYKEKSFVFSLVRECSEEMLDFWETWYIWVYKMQHRSYNMERRGVSNWHRKWEYLLLKSLSLC